MTQDELKLVLDALKWCHGGEPCGTAEAIAVVEKALAQHDSVQAKPEPEQEPVTWGVDWGRAGDIPCVSIIKRLPDGGIKVLAVEYAPYSYTTSPKQEQDDGMCTACENNLCTAKQGCVALDNPPQPEQTNIERHEANVQKFLGAPQPEQEPVAEIVSNVNGSLSTQWSEKWSPNPGDKLYTAPPQRTWVGLTGEILISAAQSSLPPDQYEHFVAISEYEPEIYDRLAKAIQFHLKENT